MFLVCMVDFVERCTDLLPVPLQWQALLKVRFNVSKLDVVCISYLHVGEAAMLNNTSWHSPFEDFFGLFLIVLKFY